MRLVVDTNILLGALINPGGPPAQLIDAWRAKRIVMLRILIPS